MKRLCLAVSVCAWLCGCASPEDYRKQGHEADTATVNATVGIPIEGPDADWSRAYVDAMGQSRLRYDTGDTVGAFAATDSLIALAEAALDTLPLEDRRTKFLVLMLTDLHSQGITWAELAHDDTRVILRTARFEDLARRIRARRDSLDRSR